MKKIIEDNSFIRKIGDNLTIDNECFSLEKGKIYGIVGVDASEKSLLLKNILRFSNFSGEVIISGQNLRNNFNDVIDSVSDVVDFVSFYDYLTAYENVRCFAMLYGVPFSRAKVVLNLVGLNPKDRKTVNRFSLEMKQRLGFAVSLLKNPDVVILDDLSYSNIAELKRLFLGFKNKTVIISTFINAEIEKVVDEVIFVSDKEIMQKSIKKEEEVLFKNSDYESATKVLSTSVINEESATYISHSCIEVTENNEDDCKEEFESLENELLRMIESEDIN